MRIGVNSEWIILSHGNKDYGRGVGDKNYYKEDILRRGRRKS